jgi:hypothetical protein
VKNGKKREQHEEEIFYDAQDPIFGSKRANPFASSKIKLQSRVKVVPQRTDYKVFARKEISEQGFVKTNLKKLGFGVYSEDKEGGEVFNFQFGFSKKPLFQLNYKAIQ